jgi:hypothetical protein
MVGFMKGPELLKAFLRAEIRRRESELLARGAVEISLLPAINGLALKLCVLRLLFGLLLLFHVNNNNKNKDNKYIYIYVLKI